MDTLQVELAAMRREANLSQSIQDVDKIIEQLERARESIVSGMASFSPYVVAPRPDGGPRYDIVKAQLT